MIYIILIIILKNATIIKGSNLLKKYFAIKAYISIFMILIPII